MSKSELNLATPIPRPIAIGHLHQKKLNFVYRMLMTQTIQKYSDMWFTCPMLYRALDFASFPHARVFLYEFSHNLAALPEWMQAHHGTHLSLLFGRVQDPKRLFRSDGIVD